MSLLGIQLKVLLGPTVPRPAPESVMSALERVEVTHSDDARSGFQLDFRMNREGPLGATDFPLLKSSLLRPFCRVILIVTLNATPHILMDGVIQHQQVQPGEDPWAAALTVTGEDVSGMMDLQEKSTLHPKESEPDIAKTIIGEYSEYRLTPDVTAPPSVESPNGPQGAPAQTETDFAYLRNLAGRFGYVFYVIPGPDVGENTAYWGPPVRSGPKQPPLSVNLGPDTNVDSLSFQNDALAPTVVVGEVQDPDSGKRVQVRTDRSERPSLSREPTLEHNGGNARITRFRESGLSSAAATARAQGMTDAASDTLTAEGELDAVRYGSLLQCRMLVGLRGMGHTLDGYYYVKRVTHTLEKGRYKQRFTLTREGLGTTTEAIA